MEKKNHRPSISFATQTKMKSQNAFIENARNWKIFEKNFRSTQRFTKTLGKRLPKCADWFSLEEPSALETESRPTTLGETKPQSAFIGNARNGKIFQEKSPLARKVYEDTRQTITKVLRSEEHLNGIQSRSNAMDDGIRSLNPFC